ncbi:DUF3718 domain-containing protein [Shewanella eurypsychrophilus]|uniref:DUF3718 domain-containing protein n=1 Tax=Shewanella eurypsychrophilus TaxID=2593656 RepID=A0ABX6VAP5_9GAMM|nr:MULTISPECIES: DUF3718 domain-containing protein [Shewanella]QFU23683.1 DUF3718 domain-containing protein [Shewanella sp. YLB-09]QPG58905.1 DUF3718 domain-containing protein [Shewanella eurypsychrophilus]
MKKFLIIAAIALSPMAFSVSAAMSVHMENTLVAVCKAGASNSLYKFRDTMKSYRINKQRVFPRLVCNGESFHQFALSHNADKTAKRIAPYMRGTVTIKDIAMTYGSDQILAVNY